MITNEEPVDNLIDWNSPIIEHKNTKPLIPLPLFTSPIEIAEDNPFDIIERQINDNELFDILNLNLSFSNTSLEEQDDCNDSNCLINICESVDNTDVQNKKENGNTCKVEDYTTFSSSVNSLENKIDNNNAQLMDSSAVSSLSNASDIKEMVMNRISLCINQALHETQSSDVLRRTTPEQFSVSSSKTTSPRSKLSRSLNDGFISSGEQTNVKSSMIQFSKSFADIEDDLESIVPHWDDISSSDEEPEKRIMSRSLIMDKSSNAIKKKSIFVRVEKTREVREPLVIQDPNVKVKKTNRIMKPGPLKAVIPISNMKKTDKKIVKPVSDQKLVVPKKPNTPSTLPQPKEKRWTAPVATSTPQSRVSMSMNKYEKTPVGKTPVTLTYSTRPPSPDSTSSNKYISRINSSSRTNLKTCVRKLACNAVSSSTSVSSAKTVMKNIRNKENIVPFRY